MMIYHRLGTGSPLRTKYSLQESLLKTSRRPEEPRCCAAQAVPQCGGASKIRHKNFENSFFGFVQNCSRGDYGWLWCAQTRRMDSYPPSPLPSFLKQSCLSLKLIANSLLALPFLPGVLNFEIRWCRELTSVFFEKKNEFEISRISF